MFGEKREQYRSEEDYMFEQQKRSAGDHKFHRLGWKKLTGMLESSKHRSRCSFYPIGFRNTRHGRWCHCLHRHGSDRHLHKLHRRPGQVKFPQVSHYADAGQLMMGRFGLRAHRRHCLPFNSRFWSARTVSPVPSPSST